MIGAAKELAGIALSVDGYFGALMGAAIVQHMNLIVRVAHLYNRLTANLRGKVIAFIGCLAFVSNKHPGVGK